MNNTILSPGSVVYPRLLRAIYDPPASLHIIGALPDFDEHPPVAVVGSRKPTDYGRAVAEDIAGGLARAGFTVVSGLAYGIDSIAHKAVLREGGITIGVLGSGIDKITPTAHKQLAEEMVSANGAIVSEYGKGVPALPRHFPARNRIISGLSFGVVVVEASLESGSLITATTALEQGREVFAVPGHIDAVNSKGTHMLIKNGAALIESAQDVIDILDAKLSPKWKTKFSGQSFGIGDKERQILDLLGEEPVPADAIVELSGLGTAQTLSSLAVLEMSGFVASNNGAGYTRLMTHD
jgi:DNA processing protein